MPTFFLFRLKAIRSKQSPLFQGEITRRDFVEELIRQKPSAEIRKGYVWHIGNVLPINRNGLLFAVGRTTRSSKEKYDESSRDFLQVDDEESPFTYAIYDLDLSVIAIASKSKLSPTVKGIANSIEKLLNSQEFTLNNGVRIEVAEIWDPEGFIAQIQSAYAVIGFTVEFGEPNPFDVEKDFHGPMEKLLEASGGNKGRTNVKGPDLERDTLEKLTRSVASTGNEASARIRKNRGQRPITRHMRGDPVTIPVEESGIFNKAAELLSRVKEAYRRIRKLDDE